MNNDNNDDFAADLTSLFEPRSAGLLVVDVQERLWPFIHEKEKVGRRIIQAIEVVGNLGLPILVTEQYVKGLGTTLPNVKGALAAFEAYKPFEKFAFSCFGELEFEELFEATGIETLALIGIESHVCVMQTALDALDRGLDVFYIAEATGSRDARHKQEALDRVQGAGAIVGSVEMFAFEAMRTSKHPAFRDVQKVIV